MKILHINCNYVGTYLHRIMIEKLNHCGIRSAVYVPVCEEGGEAPTQGCEVVISKCFRNWNKILFDYKQHRIIRDVQKHFDLTQFDCLHAYTLFTDGNCARYLGRKYRIPYVVAVRSTDVNVFFRRAFYLRGRGVRILRDAAAVFFLSENYKRTVLERYVPEEYREEIAEKSYLVPNGIDDFWLQNRYTDKLKVLEETESALRDRRMKIIFAGRIVEDKNPLATQEALRILRGRGWTVEFTVAGDARDKKLYERIMSYPQTYYAGKLSKEELLGCYRKCDLFVMPSHTETFGLVYAEAMSQGLPVIYTKGQGFDGQFPDGTVGFAVDDNDPEDIADKIELAAGQYRKLAAGCLELAERFWWTDICERYREIYRAVLAESL